MYLRFVHLRNVPGVSAREGIFGAATELKESAEIDAYSLDQLKNILAWFSKELKKPERFNRTKSKGHYRRKTKGISWFKPTAHKHIAKAHELAMILREFGYPIEILKIPRVGFVVYEDEFQIVAEPFGE